MTNSNGKQRSIVFYDNEEYRQFIEWLSDTGGAPMLVKVDLNGAIRVNY